MNIESLQELEVGEGQTVEFKKSLSQCDRGLEALCGMINADLADGTVWFGVNDDGEPVGIQEGDLDSAQGKVSQKLRKFEPPIQATIEVLEIQQKTLIRVSTSRLRRVPFHEYDGRAYMREGSTTRTLRLAEKRSLEAQRNREKHTGPWKCDKCGSEVLQLFSAVVTEHGMVRTYRCHCDGEYWPIVWVS